MIEDILEKLKCIKLKREYWIILVAVSICIFPSSSYNKKCGSTKTTNLSI
ncbi:hypothetical protein HMPREF9318_01453 [Streptococcus urinalis FB127-CNA-2]|uniref:Uncharacterized protein n=1 Tax=Streptococcus urinalis 2285-97 TaxID=764291 RepID=G5KDI9_9STRE|nr:hypothetical protein STRUR_0633 [Streptococcus urinalis 2285-97]EKS19377.1 hypothetical protein HMPREF9318_01453 [Streptococcus urinalis FB127-CNA-2]VEF31507.1 Uncharacterised protein [Streptococcus urinalis]